MSHTAYLVKFPRGAQFDASLVDVINNIILEGGRVVALRPELDGLKVDVELKGERIVEGES